MLYRDQRGGLDESMETTVDIPATKAAIFRHLVRDEAAYLLPDFEIGDLDVRYYAEDRRVEGWATTFIVTINGNAVGFTNGPVR